MEDKPKQTAKNNAGLQDDHDPSDIGHRAAIKKQQRSQMEGPAAYAPHEDDEKKRADVTKQKA